VPREAYSAWMTQDSNITYIYNMTNNDRTEFPKNSPLDYATGNGFGAPLIELLRQKPNLSLSNDGAGIFLSLLAHKIAQV